MPNWTNNPNDNQTAGTVTSTLSTAHSYDDTKLALDDFVLVDSDGVGHANYIVGDSLFAAGSATTLYKISSISTNAGAVDESHVVVTPGLVQDLLDNHVFHKSGGTDGGDAYAGNQGSVENHVRLRNLGYI